jgi:hypothetical protein
MKFFGADTVVDREITELLEKHFLKYEMEGVLAAR